MLILKSDTSRTLDEIKFTSIKENTMLDIIKICFKVHVVRMSIWYQKMGVLQETSKYYDPGREII